MLIYKQYDQEHLDRQYNNRFNVPDHERHLQRWEYLSREAEKKYSPHRDIAYGELAAEKLDIFPSPQPGSKTLVFIHGGYWHKHAKQDFYLVAEAFRSYGMTTVLVGYPLMPDFTMDRLVLSCRRAIRWLYRNLAQYHADPEQLYVTGHSAGGHLACMMMATDWLKFDQTLPRGMIQGVAAISGLFNLSPVQLCYVNDILKMDAATARRNSPVHLAPSTPCRLLLAVGADETMEYREQSRELYSMWSAKAPNIGLLEIAGTDHFSILETMLDQSSPLHQSMRKLMNI